MADKEQVLKELANAALGAVSKWDVSRSVTEGPLELVIRDLRPIVEKHFRPDRLAEVERLLGELGRAKGDYSWIEHYAEGDGTVHIPGTTRDYGEEDVWPDVLSVLRSLLPADEEPAAKPEPIECGTATIGGQRYRSVLYPVGEEDDSE